MRSEWSSYEGQSVEAWRLEQFLGTRDDRAFYLTSDPDTGGALLVEVLAAEDAGAAVESWKRAREIRQPDLQRVHAAGDAELDGEPVAFAVLDVPDDDLGEMLAKRKLEREEARSILTSIARALVSLHSRGLRHGAVIPSNVFFIRDKVRLSVDTIAPAAEGGIESDLRQFGATLVRALTGRADVGTADEPATLEAVSQLGPPFYEIAVGCLRASPENRSGEKAWTAERIIDALSGREIFARAPSAPAVSPSRAAPPVVERRKVAAGQSFASWLTGPQWLVTGTAAIVALIVGTYLMVHGPRPRHTAPNSPPVSAANPAPAPQRVEPAPQPPSPMNTADRSAPEVVRERPARAGSWAVIAATYATYAEAEHRANRIRKRSPRLRPRVVPPAGQGKHYFIVLGFGLTHEDAQRLRREALAQGAPRDTYVTKLTAS